jgi:peptidoglycan-associated lipoprotein
MKYMQMRRAGLTVAATLALVLTASCPKAVPPVPPPPTPSELASPAINLFSVDPATISNGQAAVLHWSVKDATSIQIDNQIGVVGPEGRRQVHPTITTTYKLDASGNGKISTAAVTVSVVNPPMPLNTREPSGERMNRSAVDIFSAQLRDIHFAYNEQQVVSQDQAILENDARVLKSFFNTDPSLVVLIEGHCDERGSAEYNMGLGDLRANFIKDSLIRLGVPGAKLNTVSYGKEHPICLGTTEDCFAQNRRAHFSIAQ